MSYDPVGNLTQKTWPDGTAVNYSYDADNQLTGIAYPDQGGVSYTYDPDGNRTAMSDPSGTTSYRYDQSGRLMQVGENGENAGYSYDQAGNIAGITYPDGLQVSYTYNGLGQPVSVSDGLYAAGVFYDNAGNRIGETLPNGVDVTYAYDPSGRLTVVESVYGARTIAESAYTLDNVGNRLSVTDGRGRTTRYSYDKDYELTGVRYPDGRREEYTYDPAGNRTSENGTPYVYDPDNHLISAGHEPYLYDENGNLVYGNESLYLYDDENRLTDVLTLDGLKDIRYAYDGDGTSRSVSNLFDRDSAVQSALNRELAHLLIPQSGSGQDKGLPWPGPAGRVDDGLPGVLRLPVLSGQTGVRSLMRCMDRPKNIFRLCNVGSKGYPAAIAWAQLFTGFSAECVYELHSLMIAISRIVREQCLFKIVLEAIYVGSQDVLRTVRGGIQVSND